MENIEFFHYQLSLAREIAVSHKNYILTDRIFLQISGRKQISAQPVINGTTVHYSVVSQLSGSYRAVAKQFSSSCQVILRQFSGTCQAVVRSQYTVEVCYFFCNI